MKSKPQQFLSDQEFFHAAWQWLVIEDHPRCDNGLEAVYRDGDLRCVIGAFIPEALHTIGFPDESITVLMERYPLISDWFQHLTPELMLEIEGVHNTPNAAGETREAIMRAIAARWKLRTPASLKEI